MHAHHHAMGLMINTLEYAKRLREAGVDQALAESQAEALAEALNTAAEYRLATKEDLRTLEGVLKGDLKTLEASLKEDLSALREDVHALKESDIRFELKLAATESRLDLKIQESQTKMESLEKRLTTRMFIMTASTITLLGGLISILHFY